MRKEKNTTPVLLVPLKQIAYTHPHAFWLDVLCTLGSPGNGQGTAQLGERAREDAKTETKNAELPQKNQVAMMSSC